jgi:hypothetical protein
MPQDGAGRFHFPAQFYQLAKKMKEVIMKKTIIALVVILACSPVFAIEMKLKVQEVQKFAQKIASDIGG